MNFKKPSFFVLFLLLWLISWGIYLGAATLYVSIDTGKNGNPGTLEQPLKNIDKAIKKAASGDTIHIAGGVYAGTFQVGYLECHKALKLIGSFSKDFSTRDIKKHATIFRPDNKSGARSRKPLLRFVKEIDGAVVDGFVFDMGMRNSYHPQQGKPQGLETGMLLLPPKKNRGESATVTEACLAISGSAKGGHMIIRNNVFANGAKFGIQGGIRNGTMEIVNNVFVANRMAAVEIFGTCAGSKSTTPCGEVEIAYNTVLFSWSRTKEMTDMGYGIRVMTKLKYNIHHNIVAGSTLAGIDHSRFNPDQWIKMDHNIFFANKAGDLQYSPASNTKLNLVVDQFEDLEFASCSGNNDAIPKLTVLDKDYLAGFLAARYDETADFNPDSQANKLREMLGMAKQGKLTSRVSMYGNRYPSQKAMALFGAVKDCGAQVF